MAETPMRNEEQPGERQGPVAPMQMCPMAETCRHMMAKPFPSFLMFTPGIVFIVIGLLIIFEPGVLAWLVAIGLILIGIAMLSGAYFMRSFASRFRSSHR